MFSTTKGISAFAILMQESHGHIDVDQKVSLCWPEFGQYLRDEAFVPFGIEDEIYIGLPGKDVVPDERIAKLDAMQGLESLWPSSIFPKNFISNLLLRPNSYTGRAFRNPQLSTMVSAMDYNRREILETKIPAAAGVATARAVATMYLAAERVINSHNDNDNDNDNDS